MSACLWFELMVRIVEEKSETHTPGNGWTEQETFAKEEKDRRRQQLVQGGGRVHLVVNGDKKLEKKKQKRWLINFLFPLGFSNESDNDVIVPFNVQIKNEIAFLLRN